MNSLEALCKWLENGDIGTAIRESTVMFPVIEGLHVIGLSLSVGMLLMSDLRLMGLGMRKRPASEVFGQILPWMSVGFVLMFATGGLLFWSQALKAYHNTFFRYKILLIVLCGLNAGIYHATIYRRMAEWDMDALPPFQARLAGWLSLVFWAVVIAMGRSMAYTL